MAIGYDLSDYPYRVDLSDMEMALVPSINEWCQNNVGERAVLWVSFIDTVTFDPAYLFKQQEHAVKFTLTWC